MTTTGAAPRTARLAGVAPQFLVDDLGASIAHYRDMLGFGVDFCYDSFYAGVSRDGVEIRRLWTSVLPVLMAVLPRASTAQANNQELPWAHADSVAVIGEGKVGLRTYAWRDFMPRPGADRSGSDLKVNLQIRALDHRSFPGGLTVDSAWVRCAEGRWSTAPSREPRPELANGLDLMLRGGPSWETNQTIDVLVRMRLPNGEARYLEARNQPIGRTE